MGSLLEWDTIEGDLSELAFRYVTYLPTLRILTY